MPPRQDLVPAGIRLVAFDLDGTLTRGQTCLETIAGAFGFAAETLVWEQARTEREITAARLGMWQYLQHLSPQDMDTALAAIPLAPGAIKGITALRTAGIATIIVSLAHAPNVAYFAARLGVDAHFGTDLDGRDGFRHVFPATKPTLLTEYAKTLGLSAKQIAAVGDTPNDVPMLRAAGTSIYVGATLPGDFTPTWHLPSASIDEIARIIVNPNAQNAPSPTR